MRQIIKSLASVSESVMHIELYGHACSVSIVAPTAAIFIRFSWNFAKWFGAWNVRSSLFGVKIRWPLPLFCPNFFTRVMHF